MMLSYRTNITGTPLAQQLPFRMLMLGQFSGNDARKLGLIPDLDQRPIRSIQLDTVGASADDHLRQLAPWMLIPDTAPASLQSTIVGTLAFAGKATDGTLQPWLETSIPKSQAVATTPFDALVKGTASFTSPRAANGVADIAGGGLKVTGTVSLIKSAQGVTVAPTGMTLVVNGAVSAPITDVTGKLLGTVVAVCSNFQLTIAAADLANALTLNVDDVALDDSPQRYTIAVKLPAGAPAPGPKTYPGTAVRALPLDSMLAFTPDGVANNIPELHRLDVIRELALELQAWLRNQPAFRRAVRQLLPEAGASDAAAKLKPWASLQAWARAAFPKLVITAPATAAAAAPAPADMQRTLVTSFDGSLADAYSQDVTPLPISLIAPVSADAKAPLVFRDRDASVKDSARVLNQLAAVLVNIPDISPDGNLRSFADLFARIADVVAAVDQTTRGYLDAVMHSAEFKELEANWLGLRDLSMSVTSDDVIIDFLDVTQTELGGDLEDNALDIFGSALFRKVYIDEYDHYGGRPFASMIGLYEFGSGDGDVEWMRTMMKICAAAHCPFVASVKPEFFRGRHTMEDVAAVTDLDAVLNHPAMGKWSALRDEDWAAYIGLVLPRYLVRLPWNANADDQSDRSKRFNNVGYVESVSPGASGDDSHFLWGNAAVLFAKNIVRSYENSGWAQHIRGPLGGGRVDGLISYTYTNADGKEELISPVEISVPDYREYQFSRNGLISLVHKKGEAVATFFSAQSIKRPKDFEEELNTQNAYLVTNLAYTYSISIIAHYVKVMMREYLGSSADAPYIEQIIAGWLARFVTTVTNPDDLTLLYYPFKVTQVTVEPKPGPLGWYLATISILPHVQFEGMDVELRLEASLGGKA